MSDKSWGAKATRRRTAPSPGQPHLPRIRPQSLAGRAGQVALVAKNPPANTGDRCKRPRFDPWVGMIPWRRKWQPAPAFFPGKSRTQRSLLGCSPRGGQESDTTEGLSSWGAACGKRGLCGSMHFTVQALTGLPTVRSLRGSFSWPPR